jgi:hypothetical protein
MPDRLASATCAPVGPVSSEENLSRVESRGIDCAPNRVQRLHHLIRFILGCSVALHSGEGHAFQELSQRVGVRVIDDGVVLVALVPDVVDWSGVRDEADVSCCCFHLLARVRRGLNCPLTAASYQKSRFQSYPHVSIRSVELSSCGLVRHGSFGGVTSINVQNSFLGFGPSGQTRDTSNPLRGVGRTLFGPWEVVDGELRPGGRSHSGRDLRFEDLRFERPNARALRSGCVNTGGVDTGVSRRGHG